MGESFPFLKILLISFLVGFLLGCSSSLKEKQDLSGDRKRHFFEDSYLELEIHGVLQPRNGKEFYFPATLRVKGFATFCFRNRWKEPRRIFIQVEGKKEQSLLIRPGQKLSFSHTRKGWWKARIFEKE